jgi:hypothetical protein
VELRVGQNEALDITPFVDTFVWTESMLSGGFSWRLKFKAEQWREWDRLMFGRDEPTYRFRLRSQYAEGGDSTEWRTAVTDKSRAAFDQTVAMQAEIKGADARLVMAQVARSRRWNNLRISDVIGRIGLEHGLNVAVERSASVDSYTQNRINDWAFLRSLCRDATTESGRCDTYLWLDEDTLRFGSPQLTDKSDRQYDLSEVENRVESYIGSYHGREADRQGAARLRGIGFDWRTKKGVVFTMGTAQATTQPNLATRVPRRMADGLRSYPVFESDPDVVQEQVRARWGRVAPRYLSLRLNTRPDLTLRPNKIISIETNLDTRRETPYLGRYAVLEVQHTFHDGSLSTSAICYRREAYEGEAQPTGANAADQSGTRDRNQLIPARSTIVVATELT